MDAELHERRETLLLKLRRQGIRDPRVLQAIAQVPREEFVPDEMRSAAYLDEALSIGEEQTISQPYVVALMTQALELTPDSRVLEIGTGSGYQAAVLSHLCKEVYSVEIIPLLANEARDRLERLGVDNVHLKVGDGSVGWPDAAPFDALVVTAAPPFVPPALLAQMGPDSRMVIPVGTGAQRLLKITRRDGSPPSTSEMIPVRFVPMTGAMGN
jgi:protein-L-isoaspartate(D-aspartate) O-methyltransferase